jgi:AraC-like DNA-binding protein
MPDLFLFGSENTVIVVIYQPTNDRTCSPSLKESMLTTEQIEERLFLRPLADVIATLGYYRELERAWHFMKENYADSEISLNTVAKASGLSKNRLNDLLQRETTFTFKKLLVRYRLLMATKMMSSKNYSLLEVALENGFGSLNNFDRSFRTILGVTPSKFKKQILLR